MTDRSDETQEVERAHIEKPEHRPTLLGRYLARMHRSLGRSKGARDAAIAIGGVVLSSAASPLGIIAAGLQLFAMGASADDLDAIDARVAQLETDRQSDEAAGPTRRVRGPALRLLIYALDRALSSWEAGDAEEEEASGIGLTPREFGDGGRELEYLGLVDVDLSASSATGVQRVRMRPGSALRVIPQLRPDIPIMAEVGRVLEILYRHRDDERLTLSRDVRAEADIPLPRFDLIIRALEEAGLVEGQGPGTDEGGSFYFVNLTLAGARVVRQDDPLEL